MRFLFQHLLLFLLLCGCADTPQKCCKERLSFIRVQDGQFQRNGQPVYFIGTNLWYAPILGSQGEYGDRKRLIAELDFMQSCGITNLRVLVGADGPDGIPSKVMPALQTAPGVYNKSLLDGLDFFLYELSKRNMYAVLYFHNTWEWSGGYAQYLDWAGYGTTSLQDFFTCESCTPMFKEHIYKIFSRINFYNKRRYTDDPTIMAWQIANDPRPLDEANNAAYAAWLIEIAAYMKELDPNHLVSTGSSGEAGSGDDFELYSLIHTDPNIDYLTMHIRPECRGWLNPDDFKNTIDSAIINTDAYMNKHIELAKKLNKPLVLEDFSFPRDNHLRSPYSPTSFRDSYYEYIFKRISTSAKLNGVLAGCNFWSWGGTVRPSSGRRIWIKGDEYIGDPANEAQGLNSVFSRDSTIALIKQYAMFKEKNIPTSGT